MWRRNDRTCQTAKPVAFAIRKSIPDSGVVSEVHRSSSEANKSSDPFPKNKKSVKCVKSQQNEDSTQLDRFVLTGKRFAHTLLY
jgi:hypothetical protein